MHRGAAALLARDLVLGVLRAGPDGPAGADYAAINELGLRIAKVFTEGETCHVTSVTSDQKTYNYVPAGSLAVARGKQMVLDGWTRPVKQQKV